MVLLKITTFSLTLVFKETLCQFNFSIDLIVGLVFASLWCQNFGELGGGKWICKLNFTYAIWWWQLGCKDGCTLGSIIKLDCDVNIRLMQVEECSDICVVSLISLWSPYHFVIVSTALPSELDLSW